MRRLANSLQIEMSEKSSTLMAVARIVWHLLRYVVATCVSTVAVAALPVLIVFVLTVLWLLGLIFALVFQFPIDEPISLLITPLLVVLMGIVVVFVVLLLAVAFTVIGVLPVSLLAEFACWRLSIRSTWARLMGFLLAGVLLGSVTGTVGVLTIQPNSVALVGLAFTVLMLVSICIVFLFGLTLTSMTVAKDGALVLWRTFKEKTATQPGV